MDGLLYGIGVKELGGGRFSAGIRDGGCSARRWHEYCRLTGFAWCEMTDREFLGLERGVDGWGWEDKSVVIAVDEEIRIEKSETEYVRLYSLISGRRCRDCASIT